MANSSIKRVGIVLKPHQPDAFKTMCELASWLAERNIILSGRYSEWEYYNSDHAFLAGKKAADLIKEQGFSSFQRDEEASSIRYALGSV